MTAAEALGCQACGLAVTPCLVCANPLPVSRLDDLLITTCRRCGVANPLGDKYREALDIPPISALPPAMVRRAQIARLGRRPYVLAKHTHFMHLSSDSKRKGADEQDGDTEAHGLAIREISARFAQKDSPRPEIFASAEQGHPLTFLPYMQDTGARVHEEAACAGRKAVDARRFCLFSEPESPVKRMRLSPKQRETDKGEMNLRGISLPTLHQAQRSPSNGGSVAAVSNCRASSLCTPLKPANLGDSTGDLAGHLGRSDEPLVQSTHSSPLLTKCRNDSVSTLCDASGGEVRSMAKDGKTSIPSDGPLETRLLSTRSTINELANSPVVERAHRHEGGEAPTSAGAVLYNSGELSPKYFEHDFYPQVSIENSVKQPRISLQKVDAQGEVNSRQLEEPGGAFTSAEEAPTRVCSECGQTSEELGRVSSNGDEAELLRCCTQILELNCAHTLKADMRTPCAYPLCCPTPWYPLPAGSTSSRKVCRSYVTQFTIDTLRAAHSTLTSTIQESTSGVQQALSMAERFIEIKDRMHHIQNRIHQVEAASAQGCQDLKAYTHRGVFPLARQLIPRLLKRELEQTVGRGKDDEQVMTTFLQDINRVLTGCFGYVGEVVEASLSSLVGDNHVVSTGVNLNVFVRGIESQPGLEAVRAAVFLWLRMYHDVSHASGLLT